MRLNRAASVYMKRVDVEVVAMKIGHTGINNLYTPHRADFVFELTASFLFFYTLKIRVDMKEQVIAFRYINERKLVAFLKGRFPEPDQFQITTKRGEYYLKLPSLLTPEEINACRP
ncbi:uncharacterized protein APUU_40519A [Aspergillus puulaauensis]|uniref:Uncharacterized protein n=1 Tax=Aspergillus puulaauensis TaxID=1220207 RepID=A0A7R7XMC8_9EURO|nr:uncharacterized protein APUU_40519A [Aspergillus puulaauensis]BCS24075.1 hypothetical protein APUU_40519A [Aspergillus puulaauensis]